MQISIKVLSLPFHLLIFNVLLCQPLQVFPYIRVVFQIVLEGSHEVQAPVVLSLDWASDNREAPLLQSIPWQGGVAKNWLPFNIERWHT